jgi:hypothetical protein
VQESSSASDGSSSSLAANASAQESVSASESATASYVAQGSVLESTSASDTQDALFVSGSSRDVAETASVADLVGAQLIANVSVAESSVILDLSSYPSESRYYGGKVTEKYVRQLYELLESRKRRKPAERKQAERKPVVITLPPAAQPKAQPTGNVYHARISESVGIRDKVGAEYVDGFLAEYGISEYDLATVVALAMEEPAWQD